MSAKSNSFVKEKIPHTIIKGTDHALRIILSIILIYIIISIVLMAWTLKMTFLINIVSWSVNGFFAFFMGYFGWILADQITNYVKHHTNKYIKR